MSKPKDYVEKVVKDEIYNNVKPEFYGSPFQVNTSEDRKLRIERVLNGVVIEYPDDNGGDFPAKDVIEFDDDSREGARNLLWNILEWLGEAGGKYDKEVIEINIVHGRGYECKDKKCKICKEGI